MIWSAFSCSSRCFQSCLSFRARSVRHRQLHHSPPPAHRRRDLSRRTSEHVVSLLEQSIQPEESRKKYSIETLTKPSIILLDANGALNRSYYAAEAAVRKDPNFGDDVERLGLRIFFREVFQLLALGPSHFGAIFDSPGKTFRHKLDSCYKSNRKPMDPSLRRVFPSAKDILSELKIFWGMQAGSEADDLIASITALGIANDLHVYIASRDKDFNALLQEDKVEIIKPNGDGTLRTYTAIDFFNDHGFPPSRYPDFLAVSGDTADNIKGMPGIGKKGATELIQCSESTAALLDLMTTAPDLIKSKRVRTKVMMDGAVDSFEKSRSLVALKSDCDLTDILQSVDDIMVPPYLSFWHDPDVRDESQGSLGQTLSQSIHVLRGYQMSNTIKSLIDLFQKIGK